MYKISDVELNDYYGSGTNCFESPEWTEDDIDEVLNELWEDEDVQGNTY